MKKIIALLSVAIFAATVFAFAADYTTPELRPAQKLMQARKAWTAAMNENLGANNFEAVAKDADDLAVQTEKVGENDPNPLGKELTLSVSALAKDVSSAAALQNGDIVKEKLGKIREKRNECHAKIRDKK